MPSTALSEYNQDQLISLRALPRACAGMSPAEMERLRALAQPYLRFREAVDTFCVRHFDLFCRGRCFETALSACCGFESIFTFFGDHAINFLFSPPEALSHMDSVLSRPNRSTRCVYLGAGGCLWNVRPISCAMFFCTEAREKVFETSPEAAKLWEELREREKEFTYPVKPVLFDELEATFMRLGVESPHLYFHRSPGLLRVKAKAGLNAKPSSQ
jgi:hypothetical protein